MSEGLEIAEQRYDLIRNFREKLYV